MRQINQAIPEAVKRAMAAAGTNPSRIAAETELHRSFLYACVAGKAAFRVEDLIDIANHLEIDVRTLIPSAGAT